MTVTVFNFGLSSSIDLLYFRKSSQSFLLISVKHCFSSGRAIDSKTSSVVTNFWCFDIVVGIRVGQRVNKDYWFDPLTLQ